jgi:alpha-L-fucosidase
MNNKGFGYNADFDHVGTTFTKQTFKFLSNQFDNVEINHKGKSIPLDTSMPLGALYVQVTASFGALSIDASVIYDDETQDTTTLSLPDWQDGHVHEMQRYKVVQYPLSNNNKGAIFHIPVYSNPEKTPTHLVFSRANNKKAFLHLFSVIAYPVGGVVVKDVQATHEWRNKNDQVLLVKLHNTGNTWAQDVSVQVSSNNVDTVEQGHAALIAPGHVHYAFVVVRGHSDEDVTVSAADTNTTFPLMLDREQGSYEATLESVTKHRPPTWLKQSKFGIFIHWGLYSVPAWAPVGKAYAEWYWWNMHLDTPTLEYHRNQYGENFAYDDFLQLWKPTRFDPAAWLQLVDKSRAKYFVFTTKHHDGIALFNTSVTDRSTTKLLFPNRDFVDELMHVSETQFPHLKRGLYCKHPKNFWDLV